MQRRRPSLAHVRAARVVAVAQDGAVGTGQQFLGLFAGQPIPQACSLVPDIGDVGTRVGADLPSRTASTLSRASMPIAVRVSIVALPICGNRNVFFSETYSGLSLGSPSNTSSPAA